MPPNELFHILNTVDSTNNYAMAKLHEGMAKHGMAWFAREQTGGRGQRGNSWQSRPNENIALSMVTMLPRLAVHSQFELSVCVALGVNDFLSLLQLPDIFIKWPNDIFINDRKAGGILIENQIQGSHISASIIGIGLNINQTLFDSSLAKAISLKQITGKNYDIIQLARDLHVSVLKRVNQVKQNKKSSLAEYNRALYKKDEKVKFKKGNIAFEAVVKSISADGRLILQHGDHEEAYPFGELIWVLP